jgi:hypothetical protein
MVYSQSGLAQFSEPKTAVYHEKSSCYSKSGGAGSILWGERNQTPPVDVPNLGGAGSILWGVWHVTPFPRLTACKHF